MLYYAFNKPYGMLSQFGKETPEDVTLADVKIFPKEVYPIGRLDKDSEGLLLLTNDKKINQLLLHPKNKHQRTYWVQVEGIPTDSDFNKIKEGNIALKDFKTLPAEIGFLPATEIAKIPIRIPPIRFRANVPTSWLWLRLCEGKNRQIRRMTAAIGFPTLRLIRFKIEGISLDNLHQNQFLQFDEKTFKKLLKLG